MQPGDASSAKTAIYRHGAEKGDVAEKRREKKEYAKKVYAVNILRDVRSENVEFIKTAEDFDRMCKRYINEECEGCALNGITGEKNKMDRSRCSKMILEYSSAAEPYITEWAKEHPRRTYLSELLERYPCTPLQKDGTPERFCPSALGFKDMDNCKRNCATCWNQEVKDEV